MKICFNFCLIYSLTSIWLHCVVGNTGHMFLSSAVLNITNKIYLLGTAVILTGAGTVCTKVFLLWWKPMNAANQNEKVSLFSPQTSNLHDVQGKIFLWAEQWQRNPVQNNKRFCCFDTAPVVHRSLLFIFANNNGNCEELEEYLITQNTIEMVNRTQGAQRWSQSHLVLKSGLLTSHCTLFLFVQIGKSKQQYGDAASPNQATPFLNESWS